MRGLIVGDMITDPRYRASEKHNLWRVAAIDGDGVVTVPVNADSTRNEYLRLDDEALSYYAVVAFSPDGQIVPLSWTSFRDLRATRAPEPVLYPKPEGIPTRRSPETSMHDDIKAIKDRVEMLSSLLTRGNCDT